MLAAPQAGFSDPTIRFSSSESRRWSPARVSDHERLHHAKRYGMSSPEALVEGPPFSVPEDEVHRLYGDDFTITKLGEHELLQTGDPQST